MTDIEQEARAEVRRRLYESTDEGEWVSDGRSFIQGAVWAASRPASPARDVTLDKADVRALLATYPAIAAQAVMDHRFAGLCPDALDGWDQRDPECSACRALGAPASPVTTNAFIDFASRPVSAEQATREAVARLIERAKDMAESIEGEVGMCRSFGEMLADGDTDAVLIQQVADAFGITEKESD